MENNNQTSNSPQRSSATGLTVTVNERLTIQQIIKSAVPILPRIQAGEITEGQVLRTLDGILTRFLASINVKNTMNADQIRTCVHDLYEKFPYETLEDFAAVFKMARTGEFGPMYESVDQLKIFGWVHRYLEIKVDTAAVMPREQPVTLQDLPAEKLAELEKLTREAPMSKPAIPLTDQDVLREGQREPLRKAAKYWPTEQDQIRERLRLQDLRIQYGREHADKYTGKVLPGHPTFDEWVKSHEKI